MECYKSPEVNNITNNWEEGREGRTDPARVWSTQYGHLIRTTRGPSAVESSKYKLLQKFSQPEAT